MKQLLLLTTITLFSISAFSQLNKKQFLVGGSIAYDTYKTTDYDFHKEKHRDLQLSSGVGYFILNKLAIGADIEFYSYKLESLTEDHRQSISNTLYFSPFVCYYFFPKNNKLNFFGKIEYNYGTSKSKFLSDSIIYDFSSKTTSTGFSYSIGPVFFISPIVALELSLSYNISKDKNGYIDANSFFAGLGFQIHLGNKKNKS
jgi:hypothetical protein